LHGLFAQIVIDAKDLLLAENFADGTIERDSRGQILTERLFDDNTAPIGIALFGKSGIAQPLHDDGKEDGAGGEIKEDVVFRVLLIVNLRETVADFFLEPRIFEMP